jgi:hypothetical protein
MKNKFTYNGSLYIIAFSFISVAIFLIIYKRYEKKVSTENLIVAPLIIWGIVAALSYFYLIGATYTVVPLLAALLSFGLLLLPKKQLFPLWFHAALAFPLLMLFMPFVYMLPVALGLEMMVASMVLLVLILSLLIPVLMPLNIKWIKSMVVLIGIVALFSAHLNANFDEHNKKPNSLIYLMNIDDNTASWLSFDTHLDDFTAQYLTQNSTVTNEKLAFKSKFGSRLKYEEKTALIDLPLPDITVLSDSLNDYKRTIKLMIISNRNANKIEMMATNPLHVYSLTINGDKIESNNNKPLFQLDKNTQLMSYFFTENEPLMVEIVVPSFEDINMAVYESKFDLLTNEMLNVNSRTNNMMPKPYVTSDATVIVKQLNFIVNEQ